MINGRAKEWLDSGGFFDWTPREPRRTGGPLRIFHAEYGDADAPPLLLVHGFPTSSVDWYDVVEPLSREHRVCLLDFPGFGFSDKPKGERYTITRDCELLEHYLGEVLAAQVGAVVAHDRGDSVALVLAARCASGESAFELSHLALSNGNMFLPLSNLTDFQRQVLDSVSAPALLEQLTPELLALGMGGATFTPPRSLEDPAIAALAQTFAYNDGIAVVHDTIQYLVERSENETGWLEMLAASPVPTTLVWGLYDAVSPLRVAAYIWTPTFRPSRAPTISGSCRSRTTTSSTTKRLSSLRSLALCSPGGLLRRRGRWRPRRARRCSLTARARSYRARKTSS